MKKTISKVLLTVATAAVILSACSKIPEESKLIPKTAGLIVALNSKQITRKLVTDGLTLDKLFAAIQNKDSVNEIMKAWKDAESAGVDLKSHFFASFVFQGQSAEKASYVSLTASLNDAEKFEAYLKKNIPGFSLKTHHDFKYVWEANRQAVIGWNKSSVIYINAIDPNDLTKYAPGGNGIAIPDNVDNPEQTSDSAALATPAASSTVADETVLKGWIAEVDHLFHLKENEMAGSIAPFAKLLKEEADAGIFVNPEAIYNSSQFAMIPANVKKLMEGTFYTATVNFENGKIVFDGTSFLGKEITAIYKKYDKKEIDMDMITKYPSDNITGFFSYAIDFRMVSEIIKATGFDGLINMFLSSKSGLTLDDIFNAFDGQLVYVASDVTINKKESAYFPGEFREEPTAKWIFNLKVGNKEAFNKLMTSPMLKEVFIKEGDHYVVSNQLTAAVMPQVSITEKAVILSSDSLLLQQYLAGKSNLRLPDGVENKVKGNTLGGYINLEKVTQLIPEKELSDEEKTVVKSVKELFKDFIIVSSQRTGNAQHMEALLNFKDKEKNSLAQLIRLGTETAKVWQAKQAKEKNYEDSLLASPLDSATAVY